MNKVFSILIALVFTFGAFLSFGQLSCQESDSLVGIWKDKKIKDTRRLDALSEYIFQVHLFENSDSAFFYIDLLLDEAKNKKLDVQTIKGLNLLGIAHDFRGNYAKAIDCYTKSLKLSEATGDKIGISVSANNIGLIYAEQENYQKAIIYYEKSAALKKVTKDSLGLAKTYNNIGLSYVGKNEFDKALDYYGKSLALSEKLNEPAEIAMVLQNIGNVYFRKKEFQKAKEMYQRSLDYETELNSKSGISTSLTSLALVYNEEGDYDKATRFGKKGLALAQEIEGISEIRDAAKALWEIYKKQSKHKESLAMYELYVTVRDSILREDNKSDIMQAEFQYKFEKEQALKQVEYAAELEKQELVASADNKRQNVLIYSISGGLILLLIFSIILFNRFKDSQKKNHIIRLQKEVVEEKSKEILDSINYAKRLQDAILPPSKLVQSYLHESFIIYQPKDIVAGDFYFMDVVEEEGKKFVYYASADCTGHGVPGAMVSIVGANGLKRCIQEFKLRKPGEILDKLTQIVAENFSQSEEKIRDGMDLALCCLEIENEKTLKVHYAGANNPLWVINSNRTVIPKDAIAFKEGEGFEFKANKQAIGYAEKFTHFDTHTFEVSSGDTLYTFTDGFSDQFGGKNTDAKQFGGKKYKSANFRKFLLSIQDEKMEEQKRLINEEFKNWKGNLDQLDDVCVIGVRL